MSDIIDVPNAPSSESARREVQDALIAEIMGDVTKLRTMIGELEPMIEGATKRHGQVATDMMEEQQKHFRDMTAVEIERINAEHSFKADEALAAASRALRKASDRISARDNSGNDVCISTLTLLLGIVIGSCTVGISAVLVQLYRGGFIPLPFP